MDMGKMKWKCMALFLGAAALHTGMLTAQEQVGTVVRISAPDKRNTVPETLYGVFFEDINFAADGGLYAELVKNRSFEFDDPLMGWKMSGKVTVQEDGPFERNPHYVRMRPTGNRWRQTSLQNEGFCGMGLRKDSVYGFSVWARCLNGSEPVKLRIELGESDSDTWGQVVAVDSVTVNAGEWRKYETRLCPSKTCEKAFLRIFLEKGDGVDLEHVSLMPFSGRKGRTEELRQDLVQALAELKPGVFRFPGGCVVEGTDLETRYQWKQTLGPVENRPVMENRWHFTFQHRYFPDYYQSHGIGFYEFFLLAEELGAEPLPVVNCGLICQYMAECETDHASMADLDAYVRDAIDLIEFANGEVSTRWGAVRAELGHPEPFGLKYIGIGNEQWGPEYVERLDMFVRAIRKACPEIQIVGSSGPKPDGADFDYLWKEMKRLKVDLVDEHFYKDEAWFESQAGRYDGYSRKAPKVFAGEFACHCKEDGRNRFDAALLEAAFMTGIDRNSDVVEMATYAPLMAHAEAWQWRPDLIWFDNLKVVRSASYYVQQLFSIYKGTHRLSVVPEKGKLKDGQLEEGLYVSAVWDENRKACIVKVANLSDSGRKLCLKPDGRLLENVASVEMITLSADADSVDNRVENPDRIRPEKRRLAEEECNLKALDCPARTLSLYIIYKE